jgi:predicted transcriptional regulator YdeE
MPATLNLTTEPEMIDFPATHYVYIQRVGNIPAIAQQVWQTIQKLVPALMAHNQITGAAALYKPGKGIYRAGFILSAPAVDLPAELTYEILKGGKYARFTVTGPFDQLPEANTRAFQIVAEKKIALRDDFNIENYLTDPSTTPADQNITAILFPTA